MFTFMKKEKSEEGIKEAEKKVSYVKKCKLSFFALMLPIFIFGLISPTEIYYSNMADFEFLLWDFIGYFAIASVVVLLLCTFILSIFPYKIVICVDTIAVSTGLLFYLQNMFMNPKLANEDGSRMNWTEMKKYTVINSIAWVLIIVILIFIFVKFRKYIEKIIVYVSIMLTTIQLVAVASIIINVASLGFEETHYWVCPEGQFELSPNNNVVVLVLDSVGSQYLGSVLENHPDMLECLSDFTYYPNYNTVYRPTYPSLIHMLTGEEVDCSINEIDWKKNVWSTDNCNLFYEKLKENGYRCTTYANQQKYTYGYIDGMANKFDNVKTVDRILDYKLMVAMFEKASIYRYSPYILKPTFEVDYNHFGGISHSNYADELIADNYLLYEKLLTDGLSINNEYDNLFNLQLVQGIHRPWDINENCDYIGEDGKSREETLLGVMKIVNEYLSQMKELGVYDNATIIIVSDHGMGSGLDKDEQDFHGIFFIKRPGDTHEEVIYNNAPIQSCDLRATILDIIGEEYNDCGTSIYDWNENDKRTRTYVELRDGKAYEYDYTGDLNELKEKYNSGADRVIDSKWNP